jgi:anti-sigma factor RsiW
MNCQEFEALAQGLARDEGLDVTTMEAAFTHADSCEACDALLEEAEALTGDLRALAARHAGQAAPPTVEAALLQAFRQRQEPVARASQVRRWSAAIAGITAAIVLVTVLAGRSQIASHPVEGATAKQVVPPGALSGSAASTTPARQQASQTAGASTEENTDSFVPLSGTFDLASLNQDPIVRVVLSGEDLESLGLPVGNGGDEQDEQVVADLIIANDGTPQAIRVVSW